MYKFSSMIDKQTLMHKDYRNGQVEVFGMFKEDMNEKFIV